MLEVRERKWSCLHLEKKKVLSVLPMSYMLYIKVCAKKVYKQEKRKNNKKREVYLMWRVLSCILVFACVQFFCWCCHCLSSALWYWHGTSIDFFNSLSLLETVFCILWVWHEKWMMQSGLLAQMAVLGCLAEWVTGLWHLVKTKACFFIGWKLYSLSRFMLVHALPQHSLFTAVK